MTIGRLEILFPELFEELRDLLLKADKSELAARVGDLEVFDKCRCGDSFCSSFYTAPKPDGAWGPGHFNVTLNTADGMLILDVIDDRILYVEVLDRPAFKPLLDKTVP